MSSLKNTLVLKVSAGRPNRSSIELAAIILRRGGLVAFPTETVYGLGANLLDKRAMKHLREVKERPQGKPFTVHIADEGIVKEMGCRITKEAALLIKRYWPGPLTIILRSNNGKKIGFRMPDNIVALLLLKKAGVPVVAPSANISGFKPPARAEEVLKSLHGKIDVVLDAGATKIGKESTVIDLSSVKPKILREGAIKKKEIFKLWDQ